MNESVWPDPTDDLVPRMLDTPTVRETVLCQAKALMAPLITLTVGSVERITPEVGERMLSEIVVAFEQRFDEHFALVGSI